jgi:FxsC-like protein
MSYWFFLSYARNDAVHGTKDDEGKPYIERFFKDLAEELTRRVETETDVKLEGIGFMDKSGVGAGDVSMDTVTEALQQSRVLVCLYSIAYFKKKWCGKEFEYFRRRIAEWRKRNPVGTAPKVIIPVYWDEPADIKPILKKLPESVAQFNVAGGEFDDLYGDLGLEVLLRQKTRKSDKYGCYYGDAYDEFVRRFARHINEKVEAAQAAPLPRLPGDPHVESMQEPFPETQDLITPAAEPDEVKGPLFAKFFYIAAKRDEVDPKDTRLAAYGSAGGLDWKPFYPPEEDMIASIVQVAAGKQNFIAQHEQVENTDIRKLIEDANDKNIIAVVVIDVWSLRVDRYLELARKCDSVSYRNYAVLVVWSGDVGGYKDDLDGLLYSALSTKMDSPTDKCYFINLITTPADLNDRLSAAICSARKRIMDYGKVMRDVEAGRLTYLPPPGTHSNV